MWIGRVVDKLERWLLAPGKHWRWLARVLEGGFLLLLAALLYSMFR
jgi:hypothetical protein